MKLTSFRTVWIIACSQILYFLFKVRRVCVIKNIYWQPALADVFEKNEKKNKTTSVYSLRESPFVWDTWNLLD